MARNKRPIEPVELALGGLAFTAAVDLEVVDLLFEQDLAIGPRVLNGDVGRHTGKATELAVQGNCIEIMNIYLGATKPDFVAAGGPSESLQAGKVTGEVLLLAVEIDDGDGATVVSGGIAVIEEGDMFAVRRDARITEPRGTF